MPYPSAATSGPRSISAQDARDQRAAYLVGGGIASLAAAVFLIRDADFRGSQITIFEGTEQLGGSLDARGTGERGYVMRGGRMLESKYLCTFELFSSIPTLDGTQTVTQEIFAWNDTMKTSSRSRLVRDGHREVAPAFGLRETHILALEKLVIESELKLGARSIEDQFDAEFFRTDFWYMWCSTFAFQRWHSAVEFRRYLIRFSHMVTGFSRLQGIMRTVYNQFDSMVRPLYKWLNERGVHFVMNSRVTDLLIEEENGQKTVRRISYSEGAGALTRAVQADDLVLVTLGSMTEASSVGAMDRAPGMKKKMPGGAWALWEKIAANRPEFGHPEVFSTHVMKSKWVSFTTTLHEPQFLRLIRDFTGNVPGEGGLITFPQSRWLLSIVVPAQPHFIGQPSSVGVIWGYGLAVDTPGDFVPKTMSECTGREIMTELFGHLRLGDEAASILATTVCIPCMMPFITSQFLCRSEGDRPQVIPTGSKNLAFMGQFCELPEDVVFTVEYSVRSAQTAVYRLLNLDREPPAVYHGRFDPRVLYRAFMAIHDLVA